MKKVEKTCSVNKEKRRIYIIRKFIAIQRIFVCVYAKNVLQRLYITSTITLLEGMHGYKEGKANCITGVGSDRCADLSLL